MPLPSLCPGASLGATALVWRLTRCQRFDVAPEAALWKLAARPAGPQGFLSLSGAARRELCGPLLAGESAALAVMKEAELLDGECFHCFSLVEDPRTPRCCELNGWVPEHVNDCNFLGELDIKIQFPLKYYRY